MNSNSDLDSAHTGGQETWNIWIVDDDVLIRSIIIETLTEELGELNVAITELNGYKSAYNALARAGEIDLIILDNYLVDGEGIDLLPHVTQFCHLRGLEQLPVMMASANDDQAFLARCFALGASDYVIKPFDVGLLGYKAHALLIAKRNRDQLRRQNSQLEKLIAVREREEAMASFTYEFYLRKTQQIKLGVWSHLETPNAFSGDLLLSGRSHEGRFFFLLVDATGHDLSAAITLVPVISVFQRMVEKGFRMSRILHELNRRLVQDTPVDRFVAAIFLEIEPHSELVHIWNGGMPPVLLVNQQGVVVREFQSQHMALGILGEGAFSSRAETCPVEKQNWFLLCSDGLLEQTDPQGAVFGKNDIAACLKGSPADSIQLLANRHRQFRADAPITDDMVFCAIAPDLIIPTVSRNTSNKTAHTIAALRGRDAFSWNYTVHGEHIAKTQIPLVCNGLIENLDLGQDLAERIFTILTELFINAVDHGLLKLDSRLKEGPDGFFRYMDERESRLKRLDGDSRVEITVAWQPDADPPRFSIAVRDTGEGFSPSTLAEGAIGEGQYGRGLSLAESLASRIEIEPPGNYVKAILDDW